MFREEGDGGFDRPCNRLLYSRCEWWTSDYATIGLDDLAAEELWGEADAHAGGQGELVVLAGFVGE